MRKVWQVDTSKVAIKDTWSSTIVPQLVKESCTQLGVDYLKFGVEAHFYKMLLYEKGGHFKRHKDTEKEVGMFGSLLIQLPAVYEGGDLVVMHGGETKRFKHSQDSGEQLSYTAFFADCDHELEPLTSGLRLVLAYNLVRTKLSKIFPSLQIAGDENRTMSIAVKSWLKDPKAPGKFWVMLEYEYTETNLSFQGLKGNDKVMVDRLRSFKTTRGDQPLFRVNLIIYTKHESGQGSGSGGYSYGRRRNYYDDEDDDDEEDDTMEEVEETNYSVDHIVEHDDSIEDIEPRECLQGNGKECKDDWDELFGDSSPDRVEAEGYQVKIFSLF